MEMNNETNSDFLIFVFLDANHSRNCIKKKLSQSVLGSIWDVVPILITHVKDLQSLGSFKIAVDL